MPIFSKEDVRVLFIHIPKTGGTALEYALRRLGWAESLIVHDRRSTLGHFKITPQHFHESVLDQMLKWEGFDLIFALSRHPFSRMKSEYYWQRRMGIAPAEDPHEWLHSVLHRYRQEPWAFDNHLRPQIEFIPTSGICQTFRLEDDGARRALDKATQLSPSPWLQRWVVETFPKGRMRSIPVAAVEDAFTSLRAEIEKFYAADMARFGY